jgi:hypothetical protein
MQKIEASAIGNVVFSGVLTTAGIHSVPRKFADTCTWEQILKILEENGFGESSRAEPSVQIISWDRSTNTGNSGEKQYGNEVA